MSFNQNAVALIDVNCIANHFYIYRLTSYISRVPNALTVGNDALSQGIALVVAVNSYRGYFEYRIVYLYPFYQRTVPQT
jgi:hypothetical protein